MKTATSWTYPWTLANFKGSKLDRQIIQEKLYDRGYTDLKRKPDKTLLYAAKDIIESIATLYRDKKTPWLFCVCKSHLILQSLANLIPPLWAYNVTPNSSESIATDALIDLFRARKPFDDFDLDSAGDKLEEITYTGLLLWLNVTHAVPGAMKYEGRFTHILQERIKYKRPVIFFCRSKEGKTTKAFMDKQTEKMEGVLGEVTADIIDECSFVKNIDIDMNTNRIVL